MKLIPRRRTSLVTSLALSTLVVLATLSGCATNPVTGKHEISLVSESQEIQMGQEADKAIQAEYGIYPNNTLAAYVDSVGQAMARRTERPNLPWHFRVLDSPVVNAFALPGGYVYVTRGLLGVMNSEAQLAGVIGHEIGHVTARHSVQQLTRAQLAQLGLVVGSVISSDVAKYGGLASQGLGLLFLKFSRDNENQADQLGVTYATRAGWDPREIPATYATLKAVAERTGSGRLPTILSTHPDPGNRETRTADLAADAVASLNTADRSRLAIHAPRLKTAIDGMVYGSDPRQGYMEGNTFYHPTLSFAMEFPSGWRVDNGRTAVTAQRSDQQAVIQLSLADTDDPEGYVQSLLSKGALVDADGRRETIHGHTAWVGTVVAASSSGNQTLAAAWIDKTGSGSFQILGAPTGGSTVESQFLASARSVRDLTDASKKDVKPRRIDIARPPSREALSAWLSSVSGLTAPSDEIALINNLALNAVVDTSHLVKLVRS